MNIRRISIAEYPAADMFAIVDDIAAYPDFLPWCKGAEVRRDGRQVTARLDIRYRGIKTSFTTDNIHSPDDSIRMRLADGPLSDLRGEWRFIAIEAERCRVEFDLDYQFKNVILEKIFQGLFAHIFDHFVDYFMDYAKKRYGDAGKDKISVELVSAERPSLTRRLRLPQGATVADALRETELDAAPAVSIFGKLCAPETPVKDGDRIEINKPLKRDPRDARRGRAQQ